MGIFEEFVDSPVDDSLICAICHAVLERPVIACTEGHSYCLACLQAWRARSPSCPECRRPALHTAPNAAVRNLGLERVIQRLLVRCAAASSSSSSSGSSSSSPAGPCEWTGPLEALAEHRDKGCAHRLVACRLGCGWIGRWAEEEGHVQRACARFERACRYGCGQAFGLPPPTAPTPGRSAEDDDDDDEGPNNNSSSASIAPEQHYRGSCPLAPTPCPFARFGCEARPPRGEMAAHHQAAAEAHAGMCAAVVERLKEEGREKSRRLAQGEEELRHRDRRVQRLETELSTLHEHYRRALAFSHAQAQAAAAAAVGANGEVGAGVDAQPYRRALVFPSRPPPSAQQAQAQPPSQGTASTSSSNVAAAVGGGGEGDGTTAALGPAILGRLGGATTTAASASAATTTGAGSAAAIPHPPLPSVNPTAAAAGRVAPGSSTTTTTTSSGGGPTFLHAQPPPPPVASAAAPPALMNWPHHHHHHQDHHQDHHQQQHQQHQQHQRGLGLPGRVGRPALLTGSDVNIGDRALVQVRVHVWNVGDYVEVRDLYDSLWYPGIVSRVLPQRGTVLIHFLGFNSLWFDEEIALDSGRLRVPSADAPRPLDWRHALSVGDRVEVRHPEDRRRWLPAEVTAVNAATGHVHAQCPTAPRLSRWVHSYSDELRRPLSSAPSSSPPSPTGGANPSSTTTTATATAATPTGSSVHDIGGEIREGEPLSVPSSPLVAEEGGDVGFPAVAATTAAAIGADADEGAGGEEDEEAAQWVAGVTAALSSSLSRLRAGYGPPLPGPGPVPGGRQQVDAGTSMAVDGETAAAVLTVSSARDGGGAAMGAGGVAGAGEGAH